MKTYQAFLTQTGTNSPQVTPVGTSTFDGAISFDYKGSDGEFKIISDLGEFTDKTDISFGAMRAIQFNSPNVYTATDSSDGIDLFTCDADGLKNGILYQTLIVITDYT